MEEALSGSSAMPSGPSAAERVRSVMAAATSLDVVAGASRTRLYGRHQLATDGGLRLDLPADSRLARALAVVTAGPADSFPPPFDALAGGAPALDAPALDAPALDAPALDAHALDALVEFTDIAPTAMPGRVRAQVTLNGTLHVAGEPTADDGTVVVRFLLGCAQLIVGTQFRLVHGRDVAAATTDPLAAPESIMLRHLVDSHADVVPLLSRLVPARLLQDVYAVHPLRLDRFGVVLRLASRRAERDVRVPFDEPVVNAADAGTQLRLLLARARGCRRLRSG